MLHNFRAAFIAIFLFDLGKLFFYNIKNLFGTCQKFLELSDELLLFFEFEFDRLALKTGEFLKFHLKDRSRLQYRKLEFLHEVFMRGRSILCRLDELYDLVD